MADDTPRTVTVEGIGEFPVRRPTAGGAKLVVAALRRVKDHMAGDALERLKALFADTVELESTPAAAVGTLLAETLFESGALEPLVDVVPALFAALCRAGDNDVPIDSETLLLDVAWVAANIPLVSSIEAIVKASALGYFAEIVALLGNAQSLLAPTSQEATPETAKS